MRFVIRGLHEPYAKQHQIVWLQNAEVQWMHHDLKNFKNSTDSFQKQVEALP